MAKRYNEYDLAQRFRKEAKHARSVELGTVKATDPLTIQIGDATYSNAEAWVFYEPWFEDQDAELKEIQHNAGVHSGASVNCGEGSISQMSYSTETIQTGKYKERKAYMKYNVGDLLAMQQMEDDRHFIILCKLREVE